MPRKHRIHYFKAFYHVMLRGNNYQNIFFTDNDRLQFYRYLSEAHEIYDCKIHLFCLMTNHLHLVIEVGHIPLAKIMHNITSRYARYVNKHQQRRGYLFDGRYQAVVIQNEKYFLELCYYIHMNPVKAGLVSNLSQYAWSSHKIYTLQEKISWLTIEFVLGLIKKHTNYQNKHYLNFMQDKENGYKEPTFCTHDNNKNLTIGDAVNMHNQNIQHNKLIAMPLSKIASVVCEEMNISNNDLISSSQNKQIVLARSMLTYFAHYHAKYLLIEIGNYLDRNADSISRTMHKALKQAQSTLKLQQLIHTLENKLYS